MTELCLVCRDQDAVAASVLWSQHWPVAQNKNDASLSLSSSSPSSHFLQWGYLTNKRGRARNFGRRSHCVAIDTMAHSALLPKSMADSRWGRWEFCVCMRLHMCVCVCVYGNVWHLSTREGCYLVYSVFIAVRLQWVVFFKEPHLKTCTLKHTQRSPQCFGFMTSALILLYWFYY